MFLRKEKREMLEKMQSCIEGIQANNIALTNVVSTIAENQNKVNEGLNAVQANSLVLANAVSGLIENENRIAENLSEVQSDNKALAEALDDALESNKTVITDIVESKNQMQNIINSVQSNNIILADTLNSVVKSAATVYETQKQEYTDEQKWRAAYALNLCTVSISQIIEYNDLRFMDKEYDNILNNLNLEMMPKDEALLDVLKQILDVITFFKIQDKERKLLEKEYQQKMKDAIWSAVPNPAVIMNGGGSGGWIGLAVTAAISVGTGYMNYRKEKAKIGLEQEKKEWELERSLMEQLHGLRRQLFETSWRLADEYKFGDNLRLTERQIKQFNEMLQDDDPLRQYYRLEYVHDQYGAYPQFWYYLGAAALKVANNNINDYLVCRDYLDKAHSHFDFFFEKSKKETKLMREDPVVAQCAFEYIAMLNLKKEKDLLQIDDNNLRALIGEKLNSAVESSGNSLDVLQMCAINYLSSDRANEAIRLLKMLINEYYNVSVNAQLLSMLYVKSFALGETTAETEYRLLKKTCPYKIEFYPMPQNKEKIDFDELDKLFCNKQKMYLCERYIDAVETYVSRAEKSFNDIWNQDYDISNDIVDYFEDFSSAMKTLHNTSGENNVKRNLSRAFEQIKSTKDMNRFFVDVSLRGEYKFDFFVKDAIINIVTEFFQKLDHVDNYKNLSRLENDFLIFCNKFSLTSEKNEIQHVDKEQASIESMLTGRSIEQIKQENIRCEKLMKIVKEANLMNSIVQSNSKEVECFYRNSQQCDEYVVEHNLPLKGNILAVIEDKKKGWREYQDMVFTTESLYIISRRGNETIKKAYEIPAYDGVKISKKKDALEFDGEVIYSQDSKSIAYQELVSLIYELKKTVDSCNSQKVNSQSCVAIMTAVKNKCSVVQRRIKNSANKYSSKHHDDSLSPALNDASSYDNLADEKAYAEITYAIDTISGLGIKIKVNKGCFTEGDNVIIVSGGREVGSDTVIRIYSNGNIVDNVKKGETATLILQNLSKKIVKEGSTIIKC